MRRRLALRRTASAGTAGCSRARAAFDSCARGDSWCAAVRLPPSPARGSAIPSRPMPAPQARTDFVGTEAAYASRHRRCAESSALYMATPGAPRPSAPSLAQHSFAGLVRKRSGRARRHRLSVNRCVLQPNRIWRVSRGAARGSAARRYGGEIDAASAGSRSSSAASSGYADASGESGSRPSDLYGSGASGPAIDASGGPPGQGIPGGYNRGPSGPGGPGGYIVDRQVLVGRSAGVRCIRLRRCGRSRRRCRPIPGAVMRPSPDAGPAAATWIRKRVACAPVSRRAAVVRAAAHRSRNHHRRRHHGEGAFGKARHQGQPGGEAAVR